MHNTRIEFIALNTKWWVDIFGKKDIDLAALRVQLESAAQDFTGKYSRFRSDSLIGRLNEGEELINPDVDLLKMVQLAERIRVLSNGSFNIGVGKILNSQGYDASYSFSDPKFKAEAPKKVSGTVFEVFDEQLIKLVPGAQIDFGSFGKGWLIDILAETLEEQGFKDYLINGGGDLRLTSKLGKKVRIYLENPLVNDEFIGFADVMNLSLAASAAKRRSWTLQNGKQYSHLIAADDPDTAITKVMGLFTQVPLDENSDTLVYSDFPWLKKFPTLLADLASTAYYVTTQANLKALQEYLSVAACWINDQGKYFATKDFQAEFN